MQGSKVKVTVLDYPKWLLALVLIALSIVGNIYFGSYSAAIRALGVVVAIGLALVILSMTAHGKIILDFFMQARGELRKVVWPTRQETVQMTVMVAVIVVIMALVLWAFDSFFAFVVSSLVI